MRCSNGCSVEYSANGARVSPRDLPTLELPPIQLVLANPRRRVLTSVSRKWRLPLAVGEFCWHLSASNELSFIRYYSDRWSEFADDEQTIRGSCYGYRLFRGGERCLSQWETAHKLLRQDPSTRRAVLLISQPLGGRRHNGEGRRVCDLITVLIARWTVGCGYPYAEQRRVLGASVRRFPLYDATGAVRC